MRLATNSVELAKESPVAADLVCPVPDIKWQQLALAKRVASLCNGHN